MVDDAGLAHLRQQFIALARALADAGEDRNPPIAAHHGIDEFHQQHGLADAGAAEHRRLAAHGNGREQVHVLMPVSNTVSAALCSSSGGALRWIGQRGVCGGSGGPQSRQVPVTSSSRPRTASPTGTVSGAPVVRTGVPRARPAVACSAIVSHRPGVEMGVHFQDERLVRAARDRERLVDLGQCVFREGDVDNAAADGGHRPCREGRCCAHGRGPSCSWIGFCSQEACPVRDRCPNPAP